MRPRRPLLTILTLLSLSAILIAAFFLYTFDLNRYRSELARGLEAAINRPVSLGEARLTLRRGLALDFADVQVGPAEAGGDELFATHLLLKIDLLQLLRGQVTFPEVVVEGPRLSLTLRPPTVTGPTGPAVLVDRELLETALVRSLRVEDGSLRLLNRRHPERPFDLEAQHIHGEFTDLSLQHAGQIDLSAELLQEGGAAATRLTGSIAPATDFPRWRGLTLDLDLQLLHLEPAPLLARYLPAGSDAETAGRLSLRLALHGSPAAGLRIAGELTGEDLLLHLPGFYRDPLPLHRMETNAVWTAAADAHRLEGLEVAVDELSLSGDLSLRRMNDSFWLEGSLSSPGLPLHRLARLVPDASPGAADLKARLAGGTLRLDSVRFAGPLERFRRPTGELLLEGSAFVQDGKFHLGPLGAASEVALKARWAEDRLTLTDGRARLAGAPLHFSGTLALPPGSPPEVDLEAAGTLSAENLFALVPEEKRQGAVIEGPVPVTTDISGTAEHLLFNLQADLTHLAGRLADKVNKPAGLTGNFFLTGEATPERLELSHGRLVIPPLELRARGKMERGGERPFAAAFDIAPLDLEEVRFRTPLLESFAPRGTVSLHYEFEGSGGKIGRRRGSASLRDVGLHLRGVVADISHANGEILLNGERAAFSSLTAHLGDSLIEVDGNLTDPASPRLELRVRGKSIRADHLIFPSDRAYLRDVDGRLVITADGIDFTPVTVRLDGGTQATVTGTLRNFRAPETLLDIEADYGNIDEVIALWQAPQEGRQRKKKKGRKASLLIRASAKKGNLWDLPFQDAAGEITLRNGALVIEPLRFRSGDGSCTAQVAVDGAGGPPSLLKISGHLDNFDAATLHHELLKKRGLVSGTLSGDFYLEGRVGRDFLPTSIGGFSLKVKDGVLRKFTVLAKVFSLLNVSQIFSLRLPDMDQEGMPFERLSGNVSLRNGILATEDLFVKSNAMNLSLVGNADLKSRKLDLLLGVKPLRTVDKIVTQIPIAGWLLTGEEKALITAHFQVRGKSDTPEVVPVPITSVSEKVLGIFKRVLGLPGKLITDVEDLLRSEAQK